MPQSELAFAVYHRTIRKIKKRAKERGYAKENDKIAIATLRRKITQAAATKRGGFDTFDGYPLTHEKARLMGVE